MAGTQITDAIVPSVFFDYQREKTKETSILFTSGIVAPDQALQEKMTGGGETFNIPFWHDINNSDAVSSDSLSATATPTKITADKQVGVMLRRNGSWQAADLVTAVVGDDPIATLGDRLNPWWNRRMQDTLVSTAKGVFASLAAASINAIVDISGLSGDAAIITADAVIDAKGTMGDADEDIGMIAMHSAVYQKLQKENLIEMIPDAEGHVNIPTYLGNRVIKADVMPVSTGVYDTYLFGAGAFLYGETMPRIATETYREPLKGNGEGIETFLNRRHFVLHPKGFKWGGSISGESPTNAELATSGNWTLVFERKAAPMALLRHKIA